MRFLPAGRVQNAMGAARQTTAFNCFVSGTIDDSMDSIMQRATEAARPLERWRHRLRLHRIRPRGDLIKSLESRSSGPVSFMGIYDAICQTIASSGHRRGAQMGVLRIDHPDIEQFTAKGTRQTDRVQHLHRRHRRVHATQGTRCCSASLCGKVYKELIRPTCGTW